MPVLSESQYEVIVTSMTGATACCGAALLYFVLVRTTISARYHSVMGILAVIVAVAAFHYVTLMNGFAAAYRHDGAVWVPTGLPFRHSLRFVEWLITVPLLLAALVLVLRLERAETRSLQQRLMGSAVVMIALGYPGEASDNTTVKMAFLIAAFVPFAYIMYILWFELNRWLFRYNAEVGVAVARARVLMLVTWLAYPVAFVFPLIGLDDAGGDVLRHGIYAVADVASKVGIGLLVYRIARILSDDEAIALSLASEQAKPADAVRGLDGLEA